jgi:protein-S-isoprenylcysteine O-methyltransferase Ste14
MRTNEMTWTGVGPRLVFITLPYVLLALVVMNRDPEFLAMNFLSSSIAEIIGFSLLVIGFVFYIMSAKTFFEGYKKGKLITYGPYSLCRNPIYATFIIIVVPALAFIFKSGMIWSIDFVLYLNFRILIGEEYLVLRNKFGEAYDQYEKAVNEILPFPKLRIKR